MQFNKQVCEILRTTLSLERGYILSVSEAVCPYYRSLLLSCAGTPLALLMIADGAVHVSDLDQYRKVINLANPASLTDLQACCDLIIARHQYDI